MSNGNGGAQHTFRAPQVPFDLKCVTLAAAGVLTLTLLNKLLGQFFDTTNPIGQMVNLLGAQIGKIAFLGEVFLKAMAGLWDSAASVGVARTAYELNGLQAILTGVVFFSVWAIFGGALLRIITLRLTRDEPVTLREAFTFGGRNLPTFLLAPLLVVAIAAFFAFCNALAGAVASIWGIGSSILIIILFPLVLISSLLIILTLLGGIFGLPLMWAGITVERNGALEALSRAFSYIFARPLQFFFGYLLIFVLMSIVILVSGFFENTTKNTFRAFAWRADFSEMVAADETDIKELEETRGYQARRDGIGDISNLRDAKWYDWIGFLWMFLLLKAVMLAFQGYAVHVLLAGTSSLYLQLRKEVDGTDESEIFLGDDEAALTGMATPPPAPETAAPPDAEPPAEEASAADAAPAAKKKTTKKKTTKKKAAKKKKTGGKGGDGASG